MTETWKLWEGQVADGKFHLRAYLGGSENSAVFLTEHGAPEHQKAAIKLIPADPENADAQLSRWKRTASLAHPHLIRMLETGRCRLGNESLLYVVTEYAEENLSQIVPQRPLTPSEALDILRPVLDVFTYLHGQGLAHGHLKPANIMAIGDQLRVSSDRVRAIGERRSKQRKADIYDAPETATRGYSAAGDVWSLGVTLVEILTQQLPAWEFQGQEEAVLPATLPAPFPDVVRGCLHRDPQGRSKISEIAGRLLPDSAAQRTPAIVKSGNAAPKRGYTVQALIAGGIIALVLIVGALRWGHRRSEIKRARAALEQPAHESIPESHAQTIPAERPAKKTAADPAMARSAAPASAVTSTRTAASKSTAGATKGAVTHQVLPDVPQKASDTIRGTLRNSVRVKVDATGSVTEATMEAPGPSAYFAKLAMNAARGWKFTPANQNEASEWILRFEFTQEGTKAIAAQAAP